MSGILTILLCWGIAGVVGLIGGFAIRADRDRAEKEGRDPIFPESRKTRHWTEDLEKPEERPERHWTEYLDNDEETEDHDDDWEWERQDDFGDSWDGEDG